MLDIFNEPISLNPVTFFQNYIYTWGSEGEKRCKKKLNQLLSTTHQNRRREKSVNFQRHLFLYLFLKGESENILASTIYRRRLAKKNASKFISVFLLFSFLWGFEAMTLKNGWADLTWKACIRSADEFRI